VSAKELLPRLAIIVLFISGAAFAYIESVYLRDHAASLGEKGTSVITWMWFYRALAMALILAAAFITGGFWRK
jgi:hypothetical protein